MEELIIVIATMGVIIFGVIYWIGIDLKIEMKYRNQLLEEQNEILKNIK
tara:strand:+ start:142 stop:288 length:147 start_codon:yes stop_codon:yes gene_type:complete